MSARKAAAKKGSSKAKSAERGAVKKSAAPANPRQPPKVQRWIDLLAALLSRRFPATFDALARDVPAYQAGQKRETLMRMFERDKDDLRSFGIPIETRAFDEGEETGYLLRSRDFYLPYLALVAGARRGASGAASGHSALAPLAFEPDELAAVADAGRRVCALGDPMLREDAESGLRKLAAHLPVGGAATSDGEHVVGTERVDPALFDGLGSALLDRKRVTFGYRAMSGASGEAATRHVEPYGMFFLNGHWYLAARDLDRAALRNFRLSRMTAASVNKSKEQTPDYELPPGFRLEEHARSRQAWELGDGDATVAVVEFRGSSGAARAGARLGDAPWGDEAVPASPDGVRRRFVVRRLDAFARWLLSFAGEAVPIAPDTLVAQYRDIARATLALYDAPAAERAP